MSSRVHEGAFDFREVIETALGGYIDRPVIERAILDYVTAHRAGCCIVVGEPGSGKTALAASLIQSGAYVHHFLRTGHTEFSLWRDPYGFLTSIGFQLKGIFGDAVFPETVGMDVHGHVRDVDKEGSFVGAEIQQLVAVPWHSSNLKVRLDAVGIKGKATGVRINQVVEDYRRLPLSTFREMALIDPLRHLARLQPEARVVLWIDGLDEALDLLPGENHGEAGQGIAGVLPLFDELAPLGNLLLVISSRPSLALDRFIESGAQKFDLADPCFATDNVAVVEQYIDREFATDEVRDEITRSGRRAEDVKQAIVTACSHNLLYLRQFFFAMRNGELLDLLNGGLPEGLDSIYARLLGRVARQVGDKYVTEFHPLMSTLAVAERGLTTDQIERFTGLDRNRVNAAVAQLRPFLDVERIQKRNTYGFYHRSFRTCLGSDEHQDEVWYVQPKAAHDRIVRHYLSRFREDWQKMDDYGFDFLVHHLAHAGERQSEEIFSLLDDRWCKAKREHHRSHRPFSEDLAVAARQARLLPFPDALTKTMRLALMDTLIADVAGQLPAGALELMVRLGQQQRAFDYIRLDLHPMVTIQSLAEIIRGLRALGESGWHQLHRVLEQGLELLARHPDQSHGLLKILLQDVPASTQSPMPKLLNRIITIFDSGQACWSTSEALAELARLQATVDRSQAAETFGQSLDAFQRFTPSNSFCLEPILSLWAGFDPQEAGNLLNQVPIIRDAPGIRTIVTVLRALDQSGKNDFLRQNYNQIRQRLPGADNPFEYASALTEVASLELELGESSRAAATMSQVLQAITKIGGADDPERNFVNRLDQATEALIHAAAIDLKADQTRGRSTLHQAWAALQLHPPWNKSEAFHAIVQAQLCANPDLLQTQIEKTPASLRAEISVAAALASLERDPVAATRLLEEALMLSESPRSRHAGHADFCLAVAHALGHERRDDAQRIVDEAHLDPDSIISWRLAILDELLDHDQAAACAWWDQTWRFWLRSASNPNFLCELPAAIQRLPDEWMQPLSRELEQISASTHKRLLAAAISARLNGSRPDSDELLQLALAGLDQPLPDGFPPRRILAFVAGQWWKVDRRLAEDLWVNALLQIENDPVFFNDPGMRSTHLTYLIEDAACGAPLLALPVLLASFEPPPAPNEMFFIVPGPTTPPYLSAGMSRRDYLVARALACEACQAGAARQQLGTVANPAIRALATCTAAKISVDVLLDERLAWCQTAANAASQLTEHHLQCLFSAGAAEAFHAVGIKTKAIELATATAREIIERGEYFESLCRAAAYPHALGICLRLVAGTRDVAYAVELIWSARCLGIGLQTALGYLAPVIVTEGKKFFRDFQEAEREGTGLFS